MALNYGSANYSGTAGGDSSIGYHMNCYLGYGTVTRTGNTVSIPIGLKFAPWGSDNTKWCRNSIGGYFPGNKDNVRYAFNNKNNVEAYAKRDEILYCTSRSLSASGGKNTTDEAAWTYTGTVTASQTSVTVTVYATWSQYDLGAVNGQYYDSVAVSRSIPIPAATAPSGTVSVGSVTRTTASYSVSASAGNYTTISSYEWSISPSATISNKTSSSGNFSNLKPNTSYTASCVVKNSAGLTTTISKSFTTTGNAPDITNLSVTEGRTSLTISPTVSYDTNDGFSYYIIQYGPVNGTSTTVTQTSPTINNLQPNTSYALNVQVVGTTGRTSDSFGWVGRTTCNLPSNLWMSCTGYDSTSITVQVGASGDTNAPITGYTVYWVGPDGIKYGTDISSDTFTVNNLLVDTNYDFYFVAHNYAGGVASEERVYSTTLTSPTFNSLYVADVTPFSLTIGVDVEIEPKRQLLYAFSKDDGNTWTPYQESSSYQWTGLTEETTYDFAIRARALHESLYAQDSYITMSYRHTTPADQAKVYVKAGDGATNHPAIDGYQPVSGITASSAGQMIVLREEYPFADTTAEITMKWNDINTVQNIGSNCGGYFGVANGYYTFMGRQTQRQAIVDEVVTVRLVSTFSHADSPEMSGGSAYYDVSCYVNDEWIAGGEGRSTPAVPMYFYFYLFGCYNLPGSTATIYQAKYFDKTYLPYRNIATQELVFINEDKEITGFNNGTGIAIPSTSAWKKGKLFFKLNNQWQKVKKIYIKKPDVGWVIGVNEEKD